MKGCAMSKYFSNIIKISLLLAAAVIAKCIKISFMVGSGYAFFSGMNVVTPLFGSLGGALGLLLLFVFKISMFSSKSFSTFSFLAHLVPGMASSLYWVTESKWMRLFLPTGCMAAFIVHPVGMKAFVYSLYWLIPVAIYLSKRNNLFLHALASTFVAHAVGSVIWLYTVPMTVEAWHALIPVVAVERLLFSSAIVIVHTIGQLICSCLDNYSSNKGKIVKLDSQKV